MCVWPDIGDIDHFHPQVRVPLQPRESRGRELERRGLLPVRPPLHHRAPDVPHGIKLAHSG